MEGLPVTTSIPFRMQRLGVIMRGDPHNSDEALGVLNPATARAPDGRLYLFGGRLSKVYFEMDEARNLKLAHGYWDTEVKGANWRMQSWKRIWLAKVPHYKTNAELSAEYERRFGRKP